MSERPTDTEIRERMQRHQHDLTLWEEPDGLLIPTEPDPEEREAVRRELHAAVTVLRWVLGEPATSFVMHPAAHHLRRATATIPNPPRKQGLMRPGTLQDELYGVVFAASDLVQRALVSMVGAHAVATGQIAELERSARPRADGRYMACLGRDTGPVPADIPNLHVLAEEWKVLTHLRPADAEVLWGVMGSSFVLTIEPREAGRG